jgi:prophage DNA circulation protein
MAGKMLNLLALLISLVGLVLAQTQTTAVDSTTATMDMTAAVSADSTSDDASSSMTDATSDESTTSEVVTHADKTVALTTRERSTGLPTTGIPTVLVHNAGRRPSQPGLRKLSIVVGLATYGLILL